MFSCVGPFWRPVSFLLNFLFFVFFLFFFFFGLFEHLNDKVPIHHNDSLEPC